MNKKILLLMFLVLAAKANAQSYMGYIPDNYAGVQGVLFNPASIVDSRFKTDINLFSTSSSLNNDYYGVNLFKLPSSSFDSDKDAVRTPTQNNGGIMYSDIMGPSFMFNIAPKHAIAIYTRARAVLNGNNINGELFDRFKDGFDDVESFMNLNVGSPNVVGHTWGEIGASYAAVLRQNKQHFLKGGFTAKYLVGGINSYANGKNIMANFIQTGDLVSSKLITTGAVTIGSSQDVVTGDEDFKFDSDSKGFGGDFGLVYEWRPDYDSYDVNKAKAVDNNFRDLNKYKLRFGASVTDIGSITYNNMKKDVYNLNGFASAKDLEDFDNLEDFLTKHYGTPTTTYSKVKSKLPTMLHMDVDWNIYNKFLGIGV